MDDPSGAGERAEKAEAGAHLILGDLKQHLLRMLEPPWRDSRPDEVQDDAQSHELLSEQAMHWYVWLLSWAWTFAGLVLGATVAPSLIQFAGLSNLPYQDVLVIAIAATVGFLVQVFGWCLVFLTGTVMVATFLGLAGFYERHIDRVQRQSSLVRAILRAIVVVLFLPISLAMSTVTVLLPFAGVGYCLFRYLTWVGAGQRSVAVAFVGGFLVKTFIIPAIWGAIKSNAFKAFMTWLRGGKVRSKGA